ncbi:MAG: hypothetical protein IVW55_12260 [Chloroflexi bacterium]|nr:hypothetical protein [Chloroflexota bacterium]
MTSYQPPYVRGRTVLTDRSGVIIWGPGTAALRALYDALRPACVDLVYTIADMREDASTETLANAERLIDHLDQVEREVWTLMTRMDYEAYQAGVARERHT